MVSNDMVIWTKSMVGTTVPAAQFPAIRPTMHLAPMSLPAGGGTTGWLLHVTSLGCAHPGPMGQDPATMTLEQRLCRTVVVKKDISHKAKLSIYQYVYVLTLTYSQELRAVTERTRWQIKEAEMRFLRQVAGLSLKDSVRNSDTRSGAAAPEVVRASDKDASRIPFFVRVVSGRSVWVQALG